MESNLLNIIHNLQSTKDMLKDCKENNFEGLADVFKYVNKLPEELEKHLLAMSEEDREKVNPLFKEMKDSLKDIDLKAFIDAYNNK